MAIIDSKEWTSWPSFVFPAWWLQYVQNYWDSVFIVISDEALVGICSICSDNPVAFQGMFCSFKVGNYNLLCRLNRYRIWVSLHQGLNVWFCIWFFVLLCILCSLVKNICFLSVVTSRMASELVDFDCIFISCWNAASIMMLIFFCRFFFSFFWRSWNLNLKMFRLCSRTFCLIFDECCCILPWSLLLINWFLALLDKLLPHLMERPHVCVGCCLWHGHTYFYFWTMCIYC